ncbi:hypothetical protein FQV26_09400 [Planococcus sp. CPCC 101016]|uniref:hypothetical protein n=1 Tax=Planococcus sp. CPCC 101016 TaxID=2599617 RepID=UPI0011B64770|nr:hypothetical protein [Planococcus sp. CPCC 101016]TWT08005.1 hypothetical protein FQV26_09400 [Planococcus sp. CPCC 101016]
MKKGWISTITGLILGVVISCFVLDYNGWTLVSIGRDGTTANTLNELDFNLITNAFVIILVCIGVVYGGLTLLINKNDSNE